MIHGGFQFLIGIRRNDFRMHVAFHIAVFGREEPVYIIRVQHAVGRFVKMKPVFPPDPVSFLLSPRYGFFDFLRQRFGNPFVCIHKQHPFMGCASDSEGLLPAPVAVHAALQHPGSQPFRDLFRAVRTEIIDDQHLIAEQHGFDAVFDISLFIFSQNQSRNFCHNYLSMCFPGHGNFSGNGPAGKTKQLCSINYIKLIL